VRDAPPSPPVVARHGDPAPTFPPRSCPPRRPRPPPSGPFLPRFAAEHWEQLLNIPDRPLSLFEGLSGCVVLWMSMLCPRQSHLPGVELPPKIDQEGVDASKGFRQIRSPMGDKGGGSRFRSRRESRG